MPSNTIKLQQDRERFRQESMARWEEYCQTGKSVPHAAVMGWLKSWGSERERPAIMYERPATEE